MLSAIVRRIEGWVDRHFIGLTVNGLLLLFLGVYFAPNIFIIIPPGHGGALWMRFMGGTAEKFHYGEGLKVIPPWDKIFIYDLRVKQESDEFDVLTNEGLEIRINVTLRFRLNPAALGEITKAAGPDFVKTLVMPSVGATVRQETAKYTAEEIYSTKRIQIEGEILAALVKVVDELIEGRVDDKPEIIVEDFWFRSITLPTHLASAIETKLTQRQLAEQYVYILQREEREKQRKVIEAQGIKAFQDIVSSGISENYLRWKGIDATLKLADSPNSKIVIIGSSKEGLPLILGPMDSQGTSKPGQATPPRASGASRASGTTETKSSSASEPSPLDQSYLDALGMPAEPPATDTWLSLPPDPTGGPIDPKPPAKPAASSK